MERIKNDFLYCKTISSIPGYIKKFVWTVATFGMLVVCIYNVALNIQTLLQWDVTVSVDITSVRELPFPAVTVCNLNSLRLSAIPAELLAKLQDSSREQFVLLCHFLKNILFLNILHSTRRFHSFALAIKPNANEMYAQRN